MLIHVEKAADILPEYLGTPIEPLLRFHNLRDPVSVPRGRAELLVGMCMDNRKDLALPADFAFVIRAAGGNLRDHEFDISYAVAIGGLRAIALLGHTQCGMVNLPERRELFIEGLVAHGGWTADHASAQFDASVGVYAIEDSVTFVLEESRRLSALYPKVLVAPLLYRVEDDRLVQITRDHVS